MTVPLPHNGFWRIAGVFGKGDSIIVTGVFLSVFLPLVGGWAPSVLQHANNKMYDVFLLHTASTLPPEDIVIVDIDEKSLHRHGQWPWPRCKLAEVVERLKERGAGVIVFDMVFPERDRTSPALILENLRRDLEMDIHWEQKNWPDNDRLFAAAIEGSRVVLGYQFLFDDVEAGTPADCQLHPLTIKEDSVVSGWDAFVWQAEQATCNLLLFSQATDRSGFFNVSPDQDGILRHVPLVIRYNGQYYPSLALSAVMKDLDIDSLQVRSGWLQNWLQVGDREIPIDLSGAMLINYRKKKRVFAHISAADLLADTVDGEKLNGAIVFVGTSAVGLWDFQSTPGDPIFPAIAVHATVADNLLKGDVRFRPHPAAGIEVLVAIVSGIFFVIAHARLRASSGLLLFIASAAGLALGSFSIFSETGAFFSPILPISILVANFTAVNLLRFWKEENKARLSIRNLSRAQEAIIKSMASMTETRDSDTGGHIQRTREYVRLLANELKKDPQYGALLTDDLLNSLYRSAPLHDIGKVGISDRILLKQGGLTEEEFEEMKRHTIIGRNIIAATNRKLGNQSFLKIAHELVYTHHEKWDGTGYPQGLKEDQIPLSGRLMALADAYDALISKRVYKPAFAHEKAVAAIRSQSGKSFDPKIVDVFSRLADDFKKISQKYTDRE
ncbi:CHASE2 domain-containing protein [uncultured Desulfosarcina sp.]|uniref:CHASE2 domain-containing protein n=1 Tax=uncultured Desulfosarcina sp. TaxID=218289 RepID=UPI0029C72DDF|nr:CHASE2 domain-containing protein [uncultured Desulfosarcina sp.]